MYIWILDFGYWILDFGFWISDFGFWIFGCWILDFGFIEILDVLCNLRILCCNIYTAYRMSGILIDMYIYIYINIYIYISILANML